MGVAPSPDKIYERSTEEGHRRLSLSLLDQVSTAFIAGVTIVFGLIALGVVEGLVAQGAGAGIGRVAGALAFAIGLVFLVVGRSELFTENFFDPVAAAVEHRERRPWTRLLRLWGITFVLNLVGGGLLVAMLTVDGALPSEATHTLSRIAEEIASKSWAATLVRAVLAGALITLLSYMLNAVDTVTGRVMLAYMVGFFLALGPFDHVVVSALHLLLGVWGEGAVGYGAVLTNLGLATVGNLLGGVLLITLTHTAQVKSG